jgi:hypothetical protein
VIRAEGNETDCTNDDAEPKVEGSVARKGKEQSNEQDNICNREIHHEVERYRQMIGVAHKKYHDGSYPMKYEID